MRVIGMDPSTSAFGWVIVNWTDMYVIASGVISSKTTGKLGVEDSAILRTGEIAGALNHILTRYGVDHGIAEISWASRDHKSAMNFGRMQGIVGSLPLSLTVGVKPSDVKTIAAGMFPAQVAAVSERLNTKPNSKKDPVIARVAMDWPEVYDAGKNTRWRVEAIADAYAVLLCGRRKFDIMLENPMDLREQVNQARLKQLSQGKMF